MDNRWRTDSFLDRVDRGWGSDGVSGSAFTSEMRANESHGGDGKEWCVTDVNGISLTTLHISSVSN